MGPIIMVLMTLIRGTPAPSSTSIRRRVCTTQEGPMTPTTSNLIHLVSSVCTVYVYRSEDPPPPPLTLLFLHHNCRVQFDIHLILSMCHFYCSHVLLSSSSSPPSSMSNVFISNVLETAFFPLDIHLFLSFSVLWNRLYSL